ncbi:glycoside hydrolase [Meira miltonrushii]|uniref:glucan endo-1,3-beta-D-glucosidase n=1 Tax=Meira miltonrushii TaxID=1280837 RepID=A0A316VJM4_9BASI|nr:glycoside hydrolase [Meira miltonrushii]PWN37700.1 glycoside hydrolase [Meira miltonrushii]
MSARGSFQTDERRPLAMVDTDTIDYFDDIGGIPPPHRLSGLYNQGGHSPSSSGFNLATTTGQDHFSPSQSQDFNNMANSHSFASAGIYDHPSSSGQLPMHPSYSFGNKSEYGLGDDTYNNTADDQAFLGGGAVERGGMSPAVAARERYMARKEAQGNPYAYGAGEAGAAGSRGCFSGKRKWAWIIGAIVLIAVIAGVAIGVSMHKKSSTDGALGVVQENGNDPSQFSKDPNLHQSFYGMCYTPLNAQYPACGDSQDAVIEDIQLMSQLTTRVRTYGADCNVPEYVLQAIDVTKVNMTVYLAAWVPQPADDPSNTTWNRQMSEVIAAIKKHGPDHVDGVTVGNEYLLNGGPEDQLLAKMQQMRDALKTLNLTKTIPVGTADAGSMITTSLGQGSDYVMANVHAWFGGLPVDQAAGWVWSFTANQEPASALLATNKPPLYIAETGWPTSANDTAAMTYQAAVAGVPELNTFLSTYVCQANANVTAGDQFSKYFFFEMFDEPWKAIYGGVEPYWGLFNSNKTLKAGLTLPDCSHP